MKIVGFIIAAFIVYRYLGKGNIKNILIILTVSILMVLFGVWLFYRFGLLDKWYIELFMPLVMVYIGTFIALIIYPFQTFEVLAQKASTEILQNALNNIMSQLKEINLKIEKTNELSDKVKKHKLENEINIIQQELNKRNC